MEHFTIGELCASDTARRMGLANDPSADALENLEALVAAVLDPLRRAWGKPIYVNSGYRCPALNKAVGGAAGSMHLQGRAADITAGSSVDNRRLYQLAQDLKLPYFELIGKRYGFAWLHVSYAPGRAQRQPS